MGVETCRRLLPSAPDLFLRAGPLCGARKLLANDAQMATGRSVFRVQIEHVVATNCVIT
jgi:hypothetical protein